MTNTNKTFCGGAPTWSNACVGDNGSPDYWEYSRGFSKSSNLLIDEVLKDRGRMLLVDEFVYPVCFNMRHSIELRLKAAIADLQEIAAIKGNRILFDFSGSHDIAIMWEFYKTHSESIDDRYRLLNERMESTILDTAEIDATGQTFRYPVSAESQKHLTDISLINFIILKNKFSDLEINLDILYRLNIYLIEECSLKTFTNNLSRKQLFDIAMHLPPISTWINEEFDEVRDGLKRDYAISSKELSKAIDIIKCNYELSGFIDIKLPLAGLSDDDVINFLEQWSRLDKIHSKEDKGTTYGQDMDLNEVFKTIKRSDEVEDIIWKEVSKKLTPEILAGINALFYFARDLDFSERYIKMYNIHKKEADFVFKAGEDSVRNSYSHILHKANALYNIIQTLYFLKHVDLAEHLVQKYSVEDKCDWVDDARSRDLFSKPDYCGYG